MKIYPSHEPQPFPELRGKIIKFPCFAELKIDGELNWYKAPIRKNGKGYLLNKSGKGRKDFPVTDYLDEIIHQHGKEGINILGELHYGEGKSLALYDLLENQDYDGLNFSIIDIDIKNMSYLDRREELTRLFNNVDPPLSLVPAYYCENATDLKAVQKLAEMEGWEGIVIKDPDSRLVMGPCSWVKIKFKEECPLMIAGISQDQERIEVIVPAANPSDNDTRVGVKVPNKIKVTLKVGDIVEIEHQGFLKTGGIRHPIFKRTRER